MMKKIQIYGYLLLSIGIFSFPRGNVTAQVYNKVLGSFTAVAFGDLEWVDLDNDNDLDLITSGAPQTYVPSTFVYENINGLFTKRTTNLPGTHFGSFATADYDKDGDADILISGSTTNGGNENISAIFRNDGGFVFTQHYLLQGLSNSTVAWFDVDNDDDLDIIMGGSPENTFSDYKTFVFENTGSGFTEVNGTNLPNCLSCSIELADGNGDGKTDVLISSYYETGLYLNNGDKTFSKDEHAAFRPVAGAAKWGDFDKDGDLDVLLAGSDAENKYYSLIYENTNGSFTEKTDIALLGMGVSRNGAVWFDYDNDGHLDLLLTGRTLGAGGQTHRLYRNNGGESFTETLEPSFDPLDGYSMDVGDFENDGDIDISFLGYLYTLPSGYPLSGYYRNTLLNGLPASNTKPLPPSSATFTETSFRREIRLTWDAGSDGQTPADGLTYNFYLRDGTKKIVIPAVDFASGYLRTTNPANGFGRRGFVNNVPEGLLYYAVQSIDGSKAGSAFSSEKMFYHFNGPECVKADIVDEDNVKLTWLDHSALETNFKIARSTSPESGFVQLATPPANTVTYTDNFSFLTETHYYYRVNGYNASLTSVYDSLILMIPERPTDVAAHPINASKIQLTWEDHSQYETGFLVERKKNSESVFEAVATIPPDAEFYEDNGLEQGTSYDYRVRAISNNGGLAPLGIVSARTNYLPVGTDFVLEIPEDTNLQLTSNDFESHFTDSDAADRLVNVKLITLPENGSLLINGSPAVADQVIPLDLLDLIVFEPIADFAGTSAFSVYAYDGKDYSTAVWNITINVNQVNDPPAFDIYGLRQLEEDFQGEFIISASLNYIPFEVEVTTYSLVPETSEKVNISIDKDTGIISMTSKKDQFGEIEFTITANDGQATSNLFSKKFNLIINPVNDPPVVGELENIEAEQFAIIPPVTLSVTDVDNAITSSMFSAFSGNQQILKNEKITFTVNGSGEVSMNLVPERALGITTVFVQVNDGVSAVSRFFNLRISPITGIENTLESELTIFPNPVTNALNISLGPSFTGKNNLIMRDILGRDLTSMELETRESMINMEGLLPGIYLFSLTAENGTYIQRKIIKK